MHAVWARPLEGAGEALPGARPGLPRGTGSCPRRGPESRRHRCRRATHLLQGTPGDGLAAAELNYARIALSYEGIAWAELVAFADGGGASWPRLLIPAQQSQCGCCKLCFAQNAEALADATVRGGRAWAGMG